MDEVKNFVCTSDEETRNKLLREGLIEVRNSNGIYTFYLDKKRTFALDESKVTYTNNLCF